jgi:hypothetical protein
MLVLVLVEEEGEGSGLALGLLEVLHPQEVPLVPSRYLYEKTFKGAGSRDGLMFDDMHR